MVFGIGCREGPEAKPLDRVNVQEGAAIAVIELARTMLRLRRLISPWVEFALIRGKSKPKKGTCQGLPRRLIKNWSLPRSTLSIRGSLRRMTFPIGSNPGSNGYFL